MISKTSIKRADSCYHSWACRQSSFCLKLYAEEANGSIVCELFHISPDNKPQCLSPLTVQTIDYSSFYSLTILYGRVKCSFLVSSCKPHWLFFATSTCITVIKQSQVVFFLSEISSEIFSNKHWLCKCQCMSCNLTFSLLHKNFLMENSFQPCNAWKSKVSI